MFLVFNNILILNWQVVIVSLLLWFCIVCCCFILNIGKLFMESHPNTILNNYVTVNVLSYDAITHCFYASTVFLFILNCYGVMGLSSLGSVRSLNLFMFLSFFIFWLIWAPSLVEYTTHSMPSVTFVLPLILVYVFINSTINWFTVVFLIEFLTFNLIAFLCCFKHNSSTLILSYFIISTVSTLTLLLCIWLLLQYSASAGVALFIVFVMINLGIMPFGYWVVSVYDSLNLTSLYAYLCFFYFLFLYLILLLSVTLVGVFVVTGYMQFAVLISSVSVIAFIVAHKTNADDVRLLWAYSTWGLGVLLLALLII